MAVRTTLTSTASVDVIAKWECSKCGTHNISKGVLLPHKKVNASGSSRNYHEAQLEMKYYRERGWKDDSLRIIQNPVRNAESLRESLILNNYKCKHCGNKEKWSPKSRLVEVFKTIIGIICMIAGLISLMGMIDACTTGEKNILSYIVFFTCVLIIVGMIVAEHQIPKHRYNGLNKESFPKLISLNSELNEYAEKKGESICDNEEVSKALMEVLSDTEAIRNNHNDETKGKDTKINDNMQNTDTLANTENKEGDTFCYKCGRRLKEDSEFCSYCGADLRE